MTTRFISFLLIVITSSIPPVHSTSLFHLNNKKKDKTAAQGTTSELQQQQAQPPLAVYGEMHGINVDTVQISGFSVAQLDKACRDACRRNPDCQFWVRESQGSECWLKRGFKGYGEPIDEANRRSAFVKAEEELGIVFIKQV